MSRRRIVLYALSAVFLVVLIYLLYPLAGDNYPIEFSETLIQKKREFLAGERGRMEEVRDGRPNVVLILADDLGKTDITLYGTRFDLGGSAVPTPRIDSIGMGGVTFQDAYCPAPICSPSRAGLLTGRNPNRFGMEYQPHSRYPKNRLEFFAYQHILDIGNWTPVRLDSYPKKADIRNQMLPPQEITIAELLKTRGYDTALLGKWHLGLTEESAPSSYGFDYHYGFYEAFSLYASKHDPDIVEYRHDNLQSRHIWRKGRNGLSAIRRNGDKVRDKGYLTFSIAEEASNYIEEHKDNPFFLFASFSAPHTPFQAPLEYYRRYSTVKDENKRVYYAMIAALDDAVGMILDSITENGLEKDTVVFFASDNGGATYTGATENDPLKGGKFTQFEGGLNIPYAMKWPGRIAPRSRYAKPVSLTDFFTTVAEMTGCSLPEDRPYDGVNLLPYIEGAKTTSPHAALYWRSGYASAVRKGDWKLLVDERSGKRILYNLVADKEEKYNLATDNPAVADDLAEDLQEWKDALPEPLWPPVMDYRFILDGEVYDYRI